MSSPRLPGSTAAGPWSAPTWALLPLVLSVAFAATGLGHLLAQFAPWGAVAAGSGIVLAARLRLGWSSALAAAAAQSLAMLVTGASAGLALGAAVGAAIGSHAVAVLVQRTNADSRLVRSRDLLICTFAVAGAGAPILLAIAWLADRLSGTTLVTAADALAAAWSVLFVVGGLVALAAVLSIDASLRPPLSRRPAPAVRWISLLVVSAAAAIAAGVTGHPLWALGSTSVLLVATAGTVATGGTALTAWLLLTLAGIASAVAGDAVPASALRGGVLAVTALAASVMLASHALIADARWRLRRLEGAIEGAQLGVADWHLRSGESHASAAWRALTGHANGAWSARGWIGSVHHEDRPRLESALDDVASGLSERAQLELRCPAGDGWRWLRATVQVIERDAAAAPVRLLAVVSDVDPLHAAEERQRLSASLFQHLHEGLLVTDPELRVLDANPAYSQILGVTRDELLGQVPSLLRANAADPLARQQRAAMWAALRTTGSWRGELLERRRNGEGCTLQATISTVHSTQGEVRYHVLVIADITEQQAQRDRLERQAHFDELTRLPNRARLAQLMDSAMRAADRDGYLLVVCYLDLDRFKPVNDRFGHAAGDRLLAELAGRLRGALRSRDQWADSAARLGGDEFVLLLRAGTIEEARLAVERVLRVVAQPYLIDPAAEPVVVTASMGATVYPIDSSDAETLLRHADHAMYGAKQSGRNGYLFFDPEHRRRTEERVMAIGRVQEALDRGEFVLFYQPQVEMRTGRVLGFEALLRWEHPQQGIIAPLQFLPLIENTGLSARIGDWVISQALDHLAQWRRGGLDISVSVNVSARHLQEPDFAQRLAELLARHREPLAPHLHLEILETVAHADIEATSALLARCRSIGVRFALDDFGTGYSTLTYLKRLPVDALKIDRSFVHQMLDDTQDRGIVEGVVGLARTFGCSVCAEGVESAAQARLLLDLGCEVGQGTGIAAPMPAAQVAGWIRDYRGMFALAPAAPPTEGRLGLLR